MTWRDAVEFMERHGGLVPASAVRAVVEMALSESGQPARWVDTARALEILGDGWGERQVRRLHARCEREQQAGRVPPVRVGRRGSRLLFDEDGVWALRRELGTLSVVQPVDLSDDVAAIAEQAYRSAYGPH